MAPLLTIEADHRRGSALTKPSPPYGKPKVEQDIPQARTQTDDGAASAPQILVVAPEPALRHRLVDYFQSHGFATRWATSDQEVLRALGNGAPNFIILASPPGTRTGLTLIQDIRARSDLPIIFLPDQGGEEVDRIVALELGADAVVTHPLNLRELLARVRAVLRRQRMTSTRMRGQVERGGFRFAGWRLDRRHRRLYDPSDGQVQLTKAEYGLLVAFLESAQRPLSRQQILQATRMHEDVHDRSIDVQVLRLRRKLGDDNGDARFIRTERGVGYVFTVAVEAY